MFKVLTPLAGILIAVGLFFTYIQPTFSDIRAIQDETAQYVEAAEKAAQLSRRVEQLTEAQRSIPVAQLERIEAMLPDRIDIVSVLIDIDALASGRGMIFSDIKTGDDIQEREAVRADTAIQGTDDDIDAAFADRAAGASTHYNTTLLGFTVAGTYDTFRAFLADLERSLVFMDIMNITFSESEGDLVPFEIVVRLYSLNEPTP